MKLPIKVKKTGRLKAKPTVFVSVPNPLMLENIQTRFTVPIRANAEGGFFSFFSSGRGAMIDKVCANVVLVILKKQINLGTYLGIWLDVSGCLRMREKR
jgi:hypothetical protein